MRNARKSYEDSYYCTAVNSGGYDFEDVDVKVGGENTQCNNSPFPSSLVPLFQSESKCETFHMKMSPACSFIFMQIKVIFIRMGSHLDSL